jgi:hypothetical protein
VKCVQCGAENPEGAGACTDCGGPLEAPAPAGFPPPTPEQIARRAAARRKLSRLLLLAAALILGLLGLWLPSLDPYAFTVPSVRPALESPEAAAVSYERFLVERQLREREAEAVFNEELADLLELELPSRLDPAPLRRQINSLRNGVRAFRLHRDALFNVTVSVARKESAGGRTVVHVQIAGKELVREGEENWTLRDRPATPVPVTLVPIEGRWKVK